MNSTPRGGRGLTWGGGADDGGRLTASRWLEGAFVGSNSFDHGRVIGGVSMIECAEVE